MSTIDLREIKILYLRELRTALRDRSIVVPSILVPLLVYPLMLWGMLSAMSFVRGQEERFVSQVAVVDRTEVGQEDVLEALRELERMELVEETPEDFEGAVLAETVDAVVELLPAEGEGAGLEGNCRAVVHYDSARDRSRQARSRVLQALREVRTERLVAAAGELGIDEEAWEQLAVERLNLATRAQMGAFLLGMLVPMLTVIMLSVGCLNPAIDTLAGERERSTWETLLTTGVARSSVVVAKYLYVATLGFAAGMINMVALSVSMKGILGAAAGEALAGMSFRIPWTAAPVVAVAASFLALFIAAGMMLFAVFARTFKEGQSMVMPFYLVSLLPALLVSSPDLELDVGWALVPVANIALVMREALTGNYAWGLFALSLAVEAVCIILCLVASRWVMSFEEVLFGGVEGGPGSFLKTLWTKRGKASRRQS